MFLSQQLSSPAQSSSLSQSLPEYQKKGEVIFNASRDSPGYSIIVLPFTFSKGLVNIIPVCQEGLCPAVAKRCAITPVTVASRDSFSRFSLKTAEIPCTLCVIVAICGGRNENMLTEHLQQNRNFFVANTLYTPPWHSPSGKISPPFPTYSRLIPSDDIAWSRKTIEPSFMSTSLMREICGDDFSGLPVYFSCYFCFDEVSLFIALPRCP